MSKQEELRAFQVRQPDCYAHVVSIYKSAGIDPPDFKNQYTMDLGCGNTTNTFRPHGITYAPRLVEQLGKVLGCDRVIGVDVGPNTNEKPSYTHVEYLLSPHDDAQSLLDKINKEHTSCACGPNLFWYITAFNFVGKSPSPRLIQMGINPNRLQESIEEWATILLVKNGILQIDDEYWLKVGDSNKQASLQYLGEGHYYVQRNIRSLLQ